jgi:hypothetical protein
LGQPIVHFEIRAGTPTSSGRSTASCSAGRSTSRYQAWALTRSSTGGRVARAAASARTEPPGGSPRSTSRSPDLQAALDRAAQLDGAVVAQPMEVPGVVALAQPADPRRQRDRPGEGPRGAGAGRAARRRAPGPAVRRHHDHGGDERHRRVRRPCLPRAVRAAGAARHRAGRPAVLPLLAARPDGRVEPGVLPAGPPASPTTTSPYGQTGRGGPGAGRGGWAAAASPKRRRAGVGARGSSSTTPSRPGSPTRTRGRVYLTVL